MNLDDKSLFLDAMEDVQPLKRATDVHWHPTRNQRAPQRIDTLQLDNFLTTGFLDIIPPARDTPPLVPVRSNSYWITAGQCRRHTAATTNS